MQMPILLAVLFISFHALGLRERGNTSNPSGHYMYRQFNIQQFHVLPTQRIYVFCMDLKKTAIISLYNINWLVFITEI